MIYPTTFRYRRRTNVAVTNTSNWISSTKASFISYTDSPRQTCKSFLNSIIVLQPASRSDIICFPYSFSCIISFTTVSIISSFTAFDCVRSMITCSKSAFVSHYTQEYSNRCVIVLCNRFQDIEQISIIAQFTITCCFAYLIHKLLICIVMISLHLLTNCLHSFRGFDY